jgi:plasmid replication initiation protein
MIGEISNINDNWIYQSNKLIESSYTLTVTEQKLIRLLASMIKKDDDDFKEYKFQTKVLIKVLNTSSSRFYRDIDNITDLLMQRIIKIKDKETGDWEKYHWVDTAKYKKGILQLRIHKDLKPFYLSLDWYSKYQLKNIMQFKSTYSFRLYELFKQYEGIGYRLISIEELRLILDINKKQYPKFANLKQKVLNVGIKEINTNTDLYISFEEIKESRKVTSLKINIKPNNKFKNDMSLLDHDCNDELTKDQYIKKVKSIMYDHEITSLEAKKIYDSSRGDFQIIERVYSNFKNKQLDNFVGTMISMVKPFAFKEPKYNAAKLSVNDYDQRPFDPTLERRLLGLDESNEV